MPSEIAPDATTSPAPSKVTFTFVPETPPARVSVAPESAPISLLVLSVTSPLSVLVPCTRNDPLSPTPGPFKKIGSVSPLRPPDTSKVAPLTTSVESRVVRSSPRARLFVACNVPAEMLVAPVYVFAAESFSVPLSALVKPAAGVAPATAVPETTPEISADLPDATLTFEVVSSETVPDRTPDSEK